MAGKFFLFDYRDGDIVVMKKKHPCGSDRWKIIRAGGDSVLSCMGCGRTLELGREALEKATRDVIREERE